MKVHHHPPEELLLDYAAGSLAEPLALLVATQITLDPESRRQVQAFEQVGGTLLDRVEPAELSDGALDAALARLDEVEGDTEAPRAACGIASAGGSGQQGLQRRLPAPLQAYLGESMAKVAWRERGQSVAEADLLPDYPGYKTRLLRISAGARIPQHTHSGSEYTLVLEGSFTDESGRYARGDVSVADAAVTHQPVAGRECDCVCLAVTDAPLKMTGPLGRILNYFVDM
jgi:putative transcriptional regulator